MKTDAVIDAPAASSLDEAMETGFLPDDPHYMLTGKFKDPDEKAGDKDKPSGDGTSKETEQHQSEKPDASAASNAEKDNADTGAASAAAKPQKDKGPVRSKSSETSEKRWQQRERELREAREENARLKAQLQQPPRSDSTQGSQPATEKAKAAPARPKLDDVDPKTGKAKYANYAEYEAAKDQWLIDEGVRRSQEANSKTAQEQERARADAVIDRTVNERVAAARKAHSDYDDVLKSALAEKDEHGQDAIFWTKGSAIDGFFLSHNNGHDVMYHVLKNVDHYRHIFARDKQGNYLLNPIQQISELAIAAHTLKGESPKPASAKPVTQAHRPPNQTSGNGSVAKDAVVDAVEQQDMDSYIREQNARDPRLQRRGK